MYVCMCVHVQVYVCACMRDKLPNMCRAKRIKVSSSSQAPHLTLSLTQIKLAEEALKSRRWNMKPVYSSKTDIMTSITSQA